ncbi:MAG: hypothetical protein AUJ52_09890 [Elusimicrobia bacterium CG1_02_63_36]|nr:MAG: hypothetical protein AUJ52_09890 [Elusimicrobia bacterium CG1_02_63_36]
MKRFRRGFTLIELMMVVVVLGILSSIAATRYVDAMRKANDGATKGNLGALRSALGIYYANMLSQYPQNLALLDDNRAYINRVPMTVLRDYHADSNTSSEGAAAAVLTDGGGWSYVNAPTDANYGKVWINCSHTDAAGRVWTSY